MGNSMNEMDKLACMVQSYAPEEGIWQISPENIFVARRDRFGLKEHRFDLPLASLLVQGSKTTVIGARKYNLIPGSLMTLSIDMPSSSIIENANPDTPLLTFFFPLDSHLISELDLENRHNNGRSCTNIQGVSVLPADEDFLETVKRLLYIIGRSPDDAIRHRMLLKELHYLLIKDCQGVFPVPAHGKTPNAQLNIAISYLKEHRDRPVRISELSRIACMSESGIYRHFKAVTGLSPMQYHKQLRLHEARRILLTENERVSDAAFLVGYESVQQFIREYKRLFGQSPRREVRREDS